MESLLIIEDSLPYMNDLEVLLKQKYEIIKALNGKQGLDCLKKRSISVILLDLKLPDIDGISLLTKIKKEYQSIPVIIITECNDIQTAVNAMKAGAFDYFPKISNIDLLESKISQAIENSKMSVTIELLKKTIDSGYNDFIYADRKMERIDKEITRLANQDIDVLLYGETGVGKDLVAYQIHKRSRRRDMPFVRVPIRSISEHLLESELFGYEKWAFTGANETKVGKLEGAQGGTLYLPEISDLPKNIQIKLLEFLQYKHIDRVGGGANSKIKLDVRVILATNRDLHKFMSEGKIRDDFYYRINFTQITIPPLRERKKDIIPLVEYLLTKHSLSIKGTKVSISQDALQFLKNQPWRGNVRELEHSIIGAISRCECDILEINDFRLVNGNPEPLLFNDDSLPDYKTAEQKFKKEFYSSLLKENKNNISKAAEKAGVSRQHIHNIIKELGLNNEE